MTIKDLVENEILFSNQDVLVLKDNEEIFSGYMFYDYFCEVMDETFVKLFDKKVNRICSNFDNQLVLHVD